MRCAFCGMNIKWGQERQVLDPRASPPKLVMTCPTCCIEQGLWTETPLEEG